MQAVSSSRSVCRSAFKSTAISRPICIRKCRVITCANGSGGDTAELGTLGKAAVVAGLISNPLVLYSEYVLKTTGSGLPPGPGGLYGAAEGIAYLVVVGIIGWSAYTKATTGSGLPAGPAGLLGAVEGFSYLSLLGGIAAFGLTFLEKGSLPGVTG